MKTTTTTIKEVADRSVYVTLSQQSYTYVCMWVRKVSTTRFESIWKASRISSNSNNSNNNKRESTPALEPLFSWWKILDESICEFESDAWAAERWGKYHSQNKKCALRASSYPCHRAFSTVRSTFTVLSHPVGVRVIFLHATYIQDLSFKNRDLPKKHILSTSLLQQR